MHILIKPIYLFLTTVILVFFNSFIAKTQTQKNSYGLNLAINYPTIGEQNSNYAGEANPTLGMFLLHKPERGLDIGHPSKNKRYTLIPDEFVRRLTFVMQPSFSISSFREQAADRKYNNYYLELSGLVYIQPLAFSTELNFFTGIRPSYLTSYNTEFFEYGSFGTKPYEPNQNTTGRIDFCVPLGIAISLSEAVNLELSYIQSLTNQNTSQIIKGRPSSIELTLRLNALGLVNQFSKKEDILREQITKLSKGSLLVMLPTPHPTEIAKLIQQNKLDEVDYITTELSERNKKVIREFKSYFDFCPVYFFMDTNAYKVISKNFDGLFVNSQLQVDPSIKPDSSNFFVASLCDDISEYTTKHQYGLFVYDEKINQLPKPFNVPANLVGANLEGDPVNFIRKKHYNYSIMSFENIITKFNNRLLRYKN